MKKPSLQTVLASATLLVATVASGDDDIVLERDKLHNQAVKESLVPACPGVPGKVPFWNAHASRFMFAPAFDFKEVKGAADYRFVLKPENGDVLSFRAAHPWSALSPIWEKTPVGYIDLKVEALDANQQVIGIAGRRRFYRAAVFNGPYHEPVMSYTESARRALEYLYRSSWLQHWLVDGTPDPAYSHYCYPSKIISAGINGMLRYGEMVPENKESAWKIARLAADHLIAASEPDGTPLAHFPPTYDSTHIRDGFDYGYDVGHAKKTALKNDGKIMMIYPARTGLAYLNLYRHTQDKKYDEAARKIADTYLRLQDDQGYWPLVMDAQTGKGTVSNHANSFEIREFLERFAADYGIDKYKSAVQKAEALWIQKLDSFKFEAQFEDARPGKVNRNLAGIPAQQAARYYFGKALDEEDKALRDSLIEKAENFLRFAEDQFVVWSDPIPQPRPTSKRSSSDWILVPCALEQYHCYRPIDIHAAFFVSAFAEAWKATGKEIYLAKAISLANSETRAQEKDTGRYSTWWEHSMYKTSGWLNCAVGSALEMQEFGEMLPEWKVE